MRYSFDPIFAAECHEDGRLEEWERLRGESVCRDCQWCAVPDEKWYANPGKIAYCTHDEVHEFVRWTDSVGEMECDWFAPVGWY